MMPMDDSIIVDPFEVKDIGGDKKTPLAAAPEFHMEFSDDCLVNVSDKKKLVEDEE